MNEKIKIIARELINGATTDTDLYALDGKIAFQTSASDYEEAINNFELNYPQIRWNRIEIIG